MAESTYTCRWCRTPSQAANLVSCPTCGAPVDVRDMVSRSGWYELPAVPDMARIQFGRSYCQIEGAYVPVADFNLTAGDGVYFAHRATFRHQDPQAWTQGISQHRGRRAIETDLLCKGEGGQIHCRYGAGAGVGDEGISGKSAALPARATSQRLVSKPCA